MATSQNTKTPEFLEPKENITIYETTYKKGNLMQKLHFRHEGGLTTAIAKVKSYCYRHHLMHIHTVPFLVNLDETIIDACENGMTDEVIDISK